MAKFLIIRFSSIGDIVLTSPVLRCLKEQVGEAEIHFLTKHEYEIMFFANPYITKVHFLMKDNFTELLSELKTYKFDYIIDLHNNLRTQIVKRTLNVKSFSFKKINFQKWIKVYTKLNILPDIHIVDRYLDTLKTFNVQNDNKGLDYFVPAGNEMDLRDFPKNFLDNYMVIAVGAGHQTKTIPIKILKDICSKSLFPVVFVGGAKDRLFAQEIIDGVDGVFVNACGIYNINESAELVRNSNLVITGDTGLMHITAAFKKPLISIWGNTIPGFGMYPYIPGKHSYIIEVDNLWCRPCSKIGFQECPLRHFNCMNKISVDKVVAITNILFKESETTPIISK